MTFADLHPEDVKAEIKKRYGSVAKFEREKDLPRGSVYDLLRGYTSSRVSDAIEKSLLIPVADYVKTDNSNNVSKNHCKKSEAA